ncbi:NHL repeat-containing protein 2 [Eumeta japonica]|uniref:NHL repeat-containing protein 2 n=1 Tax=Eumeta variegata TaxID=151549 RepID=A0A4C2AE36_EUMVA|nr:NHL repeat-containing protein 2 [Eumeta japonica]
MDSSPLDYVAQECMDLSEALAAANELERESLIDSHLTKVYAAGSPVKDFKKNLAHIEKLHSVEDGLVVIGVHCAKFANEKHSENILAAVERYNIKHPVVNDAESSTWDCLGIRCWPTLLILGPSNIPLFVLTGEGHREELTWFVGGALRHFGSKISKSSLPISPATHIQSTPSSVLSFPGKIALNPFYRGRADEPFLAISDTGNHRILLTDCSGGIQKIIGGNGPGFKDGRLEEASFHSPQGLCWLSPNVLVVCDTDNHAVRTVHLDENSVEILAGTGEQANYKDNASVQIRVCRRACAWERRAWGARQLLLTTVVSGKCLGMQALSSPWDILLFTTPDMDMSVRSALPLPVATPDKPENNNEATAENEKNDEKRRVLLVACAGSHQIWAIFLDTTIWWKYKTYTEGTCVCIAGSGKEAARNSMYPNTATFAQPSGLALKSGNFPELFIADSESSSIRKLSLSTGQVSAVAGGDRNPLNLFAFGIVDDVGFDAKFQHPLGLTYCESSKLLYVADTYNNKIRKVDVLSHRVTTDEGPSIYLNEPRIAIGNIHRTVTTHKTSAKTDGVQRIDNHQSMMFVNRKQSMSSCLPTELRK